MPLQRRNGRRRFPLWVTMTWQADSYRPNHLLELLPSIGLNLRPNTTYAAIVTDRMPVLEGGQLQQNGTLRLLLNARENNGVPASARATFAPLRDWLAANGVAADSIMAATVWRTGDPAAAVYRVADWVARQDSPQPTALHVKLSTPSYRY